MAWRITLFRKLFMVADQIKAAAVCVMRPEDLVSFTKSYYLRDPSVDAWSDPKLIANGLREDEIDLLNKVPVRTGRLLLLGVGGGREAVPLAQMGFEVTGVDFVKEMVDRALLNALTQDVRIEGMVQDISDLEVPPASFDVIWLSTALYSAVPTRVRRVAMLRRIHSALRPQGFVVCQFAWDPSIAYSPRGKRLRKAIAWVTFGNKEFEEGDLLVGDREFIHAFRNESEIRAEFEAGGFVVQSLDFDKGVCLGGAILVKEST